MTGAELWVVAWSLVGALGVGIAELRDARARRDGRPVSDAGRRVSDRPRTPSPSTFAKRSRGGIS